MSYQLIQENVRTARKPHRCTWCGQQILPGEKYRAERCIFDGDFQANDWHPECDEAFAALVCSEGGYAEYTPWENERPQQGTR